MNNINLTLSHVHLHCEPLERPAPLSQCFLLHKQDPISSKPKANIIQTIHTQELAQQKASKLKVVNSKGQRLGSTDQFSGELDGGFTVAISLAGAAPTENTDPFKP